MTTSTDDVLAYADDLFGAGPEEPVSMHASCCMLQGLLTSLGIMLTAPRMVGNTGIGLLQASADLLVPYSGDPAVLTVFSCDLPKQICSSQGS